MRLKQKQILIAVILLAAAGLVSGCLWSGFSELAAPTKAAAQKTLSPQEALTATSAAFYLRLTQTERSLWTSTPTFQATDIPQPVPPTATLEPPATSTQPPLPSDTPQLTPLPSGTMTVTLFDDFSTNTGWFVNSTEAYTIALTDGGYRFTVKVPKTPIWSTRARELPDVYLGVDATQQAGPDDGYFGLICRQQEGGSYYALVISSDGSYGIAKSNHGQLEFLQEGKDQGNVINPAGSLNRIGADCIGDTLALLVNGEKLLEVVDDDLKTGNIGVIAGNRASGGTDVIFDNFGAVLP